jgi:hypothetical protein
MRIFHERVKLIAKRLPQEEGTSSIGKFCHRERNLAPSSLAEKFNLLMALSISDMRQAKYSCFDIDVNKNYMNEGE